MKRRSFSRLAAATPVAALLAVDGRAQGKKGRTFDFVQVDVFTTRTLEGNPLAVFSRADGLSDDEMQAIARELNHSETTFILPSTGKGDAVVRIFTPTTEMPFAGHPTLGTAFVLAQAHRDKPRLQLEERVGVIPVTVARRDDGTFLEMRQNDPVFGAKYSDKDALARSLGFPAEELDSRYTPQVVSTGTAFLIVPLRKRNSLERLTGGALSKEDRERLGTGGVYYIVTGDNQIEARLLGRAEDPATGSAAGCATAFLVQYGRQKPDVQFTIDRKSVV
jgi:trans-2,3-dihydro-3-hydroxyanthranilate isomerase